MKKISQAALLALGISLEACAPYEWSDLPDSNERDTIEQRINDYNRIAPLAADLVRKSPVSLLDKYGNYDDPGNEQVAKDLIERNQLVDWFYKNDRIRLFDGEDYKGKADKTPAGMYDSNLGQEHKNDWLYVKRDRIADVGIYAHEIDHFYFSGFYFGHSKEVYEYMLNEKERKSGERLKYGIDQEDPALQDEDLIRELRSFFWDINPVVYMENEMEDILEEVDREHITPQQGYDKLYKCLQGKMRDFYSETIPMYMYDEDGNYDENYGLWPLQVESDDMIDTVVNNENMQEWYKFLQEYLLDEYASEFLDHEIETIAERQGLEQRERQVADLDGYRPRRLR